MNPSGRSSLPGLPMVLPAILPVDFEDSFEHAAAELLDTRP
ncbi:MAG: hypothetical protein QMD04_04470 [Anaerolineales bacterium]|nr:hypothetical protein [Anaerolineales bacterium]